jgi:hypothetical protein
VPSRFSVLGSRLSTAQATPDLTRYRFRLGHPSVSLYCQAVVVQIATPRVAWSSAIAHCSRNYNNLNPCPSTTGPLESQAISSPLPLHFFFIPSNHPSTTIQTSFATSTWPPTPTGPSAPSTPPQAGPFSLCVVSNSMIACST